MLKRRPRHTPISTVKGKDLTAGGLVLPRYFPKNLRVVRAALRDTKTREGTIMDDYLQRVRLRAYLIWEKQGRPEGLAVDHWLEAEQQVANEPGAAGLQ